MVKMAHKQRYICMWWSHLPSPWQPWAEDSLLPNHLILDPFYLQTYASTAIIPRGTTVPCAEKSGEAAAALQQGSALSASRRANDAQNVRGRSRDPCCRAIQHTHVYLAQLHGGGVYVFKLEQTRFRWACSVKVTLKSLVLFCCFRNQII